MYSNNVLSFIARTVLLCGIFVSGVSFAADDLQMLLKNIQSMQADFKQTIYSEHNTALHEYVGNMAFKKPNFFRWEVQSPDPLLVITNGQKLWNYDMDLAQVSIQNYTDNKEVTPLSFILDDPDHLYTNFQVKAMPNHCYKLTPQKENSSFAMVEVCFVQNSVASVDVLDHLGQISRFAFSQVKNNLQIANKLFEFKPPAGVDVVGE